VSPSCRFDRLGVALGVLPTLPLFALHRRVVQSPLPSSCRLVRVGEWLGRQLGGVEDPAVEFAGACGQVRADAHQVLAELAEPGRVGS
jgi:hypothetical protein